ncbi:PQQ-binding-like beta-propeller repeat protein [Streptomyces sp. ISL-36]|uniref:serine/threonine-protein kinase n=1 Tax=Streptomyces sp. ISL-36 TaxID=2819182 RepID=UPI001BEBFF83|nr:serine/threonine-protein kinase [Streptomyces sp. ISL-36]MBT2442891.1 PQQ-binding-like beta-propeller repeat protein [Streptomyces sp. ISL-36]
MSLVLPLLPDDPERLGAYALVGRLGGGGMGTVFLARTPGGRLAAVKTVRSDLRDRPEFRERLLLEAEAVRALGAAHTAEFLGADADAASPWLATGYVIGPSLAEAVAAGGPLPEEAVRALGSALAGTLAALHRAGLVHRDLKPSNVLITARGPKLIDFGLAQAPGSPRLTATGQVAGTPAYMSPEQARGGRHGPQGDVFALGAVLVFASSGHGPYDGRPGRDAPGPLGDGADPDLAGVPEGLRDTLVPCLAPAPDDRPSLDRLPAWWGPFDADEFADLLPHALLADLSRRIGEITSLGAVPLRDPSARRTLSRHGLSRRTVIAGAAAALTGAGASALWLTGALPGSGGRTARPGPGRSAAGRPPGTAPKPLWSVPVPLETAPPLATDQVLVHGSDDLRGMSTADGRILWRTPVTALELALSAGRLAGLSLDDAGASMAGYADPRTGRLAADSAGRSVLGDLSSFSSLLTADAECLYIQAFYASDDQYTEPWLLAYDLRARRLRWRHRIEGGFWMPGNSLTVSAVVSGGRLICSDQARIFTVDVRDGRLLWARRVRTEKQAASPTESGGAHPPVASDRHAFDVNDVITAVDLTTGAIAWTLEPDDPVGLLSAPVCVDGTVYVAARSFRAYEERTGKKLWTHDPGPYFGRIAIPDPFRGELYAGVGEGGQAVVAVDVGRRRTSWTLSAGAVNMPHGPTALTHRGNRLYLQSFERLAAVSLG